jgi:hypothetical protein
MERNKNIKGSEGNRCSTRRRITPVGRDSKCDEWNDVSDQVFADIRDLFATHRKADVMLVLSFMVFAGAFAVAGMMIVSSIAPQWDRIVRLAMGNVEPAFQPLRTLAVAERRIAVRRWASTPAPAPALRWNAAA